MKNLDVFLEKNKKAIEKEQKEKNSPLKFLDTENYGDMISEIEKLKKNHNKIATIMLDEDNVELADALFDYVSRE